MNNAVGIFIFIFFGFILWLVVFLFKKRKKQKTSFKSIDMEGFMLMDDVVNIKREFGEGALLTFINDDKFNDELRLKAFLIISELRTPQNIELLKLGLMDKQDEIRLLSFFVLNELENNLNEKLYYFQSLLQKEHKVKYYKRLAKLYWEFIYFRLVDDDFKDFILEKVSFNVKKVLEEEYDMESLFLLAKTLMLQKKFDEAFVIFKKIGETKETAPFLVELYFYRKEYRKVKQLISSHPEIEFIEKFYFISRLWNDKN